MSTMASQITSVSIYLFVCSGADQRKHQSSASPAFVRGIRRWPVSSPHKGPVTRKLFPFDDVIMLSIHFRCPSTEIAPHFSYSKIRGCNWFLINLNCLIVIQVASNKALGIVLDNAETQTSLLRTRNMHRHRDFTPGPIPGMLFSIQRLILAWLWNMKSVWKDSFYQ